MRSQLPNRVIVFISLCLLISLTACTPALTVQPSHPVNAVEYRDKPISPDLLTLGVICDVQTGAKWSDVWHAYLCQRTQTENQNCNLEKIGKQPESTYCKVDPHAHPPQ